MAARRSSALAASLAFVLAACVGSSTPAEDARGDDAVTVASFNFPESVLLAEIYAQAIQGAGIRVEREPSLGPRELVMPALLQGLVEFVPEYAGSGLQFLAGDGSTSPDQQINHQRFAERLGKLDVTAFDASPAEDQNGFAVTAETAQRYGLRTLSDLATVSRGLVFGGPPECTRRPFCIPGLERSYGITFGQVFSNLDTGGPRTVSALAEGTVDVALLFTSDGAIDLNDFVLLEDDLNLQPAENVTPVGHRERGLGVAVHRRAPNAERGGRAWCDPPADREGLARVERSRTGAAVESPDDDGREDRRDRAR
jgi:osmoprotectant transport system substrate-binding protein